MRPCEGGLQQAPAQAPAAIFGCDHHAEQSPVFGVDGDREVAHAGCVSVRDEHQRVLAAQNVAPNCSTLGAIHRKFGGEKATLACDRNEQVNEGFQIAFDGGPDPCGLRRRR
ncbi:MAG: hypothetical protein NVS1B14_05150 [Vulcanimicrobiaceae bacterium]